MRPHGAARFPQSTCVQPKARNAENYALARQGAVLFQTRRPLCPLFRDSCTALPSGRPDFFKFHLTIPFPLW